MLTPENLQLHLVSSLDATERRLAAALGPLEGKTFLFITTARLAEGRPLDPGETLPLTSFGVTAEICDIREETPLGFVRRLKAADGCVLLGGNTFALMAALSEIAFDNAMTLRASKGAFPLVGESAGAVVMGQTICHVASMDDPSAAPEWVSEGLGWIDARILPHRGCELYGFGEKVEEIISADPHPETLMILGENELRSFAS